MRPVRTFAAASRVCKWNRLSHASGLRVRFAIRSSRTLVHTRLFFQLLLGWSGRCAAPLTAGYNASDPMPCALHILNADGKLSPWIERINAAFAATSTLVETRLPVGPVDVVVYNDADYVVPELGMSGFCTSPRRMYLPLDIEHPDLLANFEAVFQGFFAHELHHCARRAIPGFSDTLAQALVSEGLACCFEAELPGGRVPMYATRVTGHRLQAVRDRASQELHAPLQGWGAWFFGEHEPDVPRHAGYALGYELVSQWLSKHGRTAAQAYAQPACQFFAQA